MGDISRQLGKEERTPAPARSGFEHWADSPGMVEQERSAMRAARTHAPPSVASSQTLPPPVPEKDPLAQLARLMDKGESSPREAALARLFDQPTPARTAPQPMRAAAPEPEKQPEPEKTAPPIAPPTPRPEPEKNAALPRVMPPLFTPPIKPPEPQKTQPTSDAPESAKPTTTPTGKHTHETDPMDDFVSPERRKKAAEEAAARANDPSRSHDRGGRGRTR
jgi:hypothetical protein